MASGSNPFAYERFQHPTREAKVVRVGYNWPAFYLGPAWMMWSGLYVRAVVWFILIGSGGLAAPEVLLIWPLFAYRCLKNGNRWLCERLLRKGYKRSGAIFAWTKKLAIDGQGTYIKSHDHFPVRKGHHLLNLLPSELLFFKEHMMVLPPPNLHDTADCVPVCLSCLQVSMLPIISAGLIKKSKADASVYCMLGACYREIGNHTKAVPTLLRAIELDPDLFESHYFISEAYYELTQDEKAVAHARLAASLVPHTNPDAWNAVSTVFIRTRAFEEAACTANRALELAPDNALYRSNLRDAIMRKSRRTGIAESLQRWLMQVLCRRELKMSEYWESDNVRNS